jgi:flagellar hook-associated protein 2
MIDVASIVSGLMQVEDRPMNDLNAKISTSNTKISVLGQFQSKLSAVQSALTALQTPSYFLGSVASSSTSVATATPSGQLSAGTYSLNVSQTAQAALTNITGFTGADAALNGATYSITVGGQTYSTDSTVTSLSGLTNWINSTTGLSGLVQASVVQSSNGQYVLSLRGLATGASNNMAVSVTTPATSGTSGPTTANVANYQNATDAAFTLNGVAFTRSTNTITDAVSGMTVNLLSNGSTSLTPSNTDSTQAQGLLTNLVNAYNSLLDYYNSQTASSADPTTRGVLNSDYSLQSVMHQLQTALTSSLTDAKGQPLKNPSNTSDTSPQFMNLLGLEFNSDGHLNLNSTLLAQSTLLPSVLASGIRIGFNPNANKDLSQSITAMVGVNGAVYQRVQEEKSLQTQMAQQKVDLQDRLDRLQQQYTAQYSALDALLFQLNSTSTALQSSLSALTNNTKTN